MLKKMMLAGFGLVLAIGLVMPPAAEAQVRLGVQIGAPAPVVVYSSGYHEGYYYEDGYRYQRDRRGYRHYDRGYGGHNNWKHDRDHRDGNHHDNHHPDGDHRDWRR